MRYRVLAVSILACAAAASGCNSPSSSGQSFPTDGPHSGLMIPLPGKEGFAEILTEEATSAKSARAGRPPRTIVVYFLGSDKQSAVSTAPTAVSVTLLGASAGPAITLSPAVAPKDPAGAARFASAAGDYDLSRRRAKLTADFAGGQKVDEEFLIP